MILPDNETKLDLINNMAIAKTIVSIIKDSTESISIGIHGDWGAGKSSILVMVEELLTSALSENDNLGSGTFYDQELDWDNWDLEEPEDALDEEPNEPIEGIVTIRFNSWQYQGFEDAKIALISAIVKALQKESKLYLKKHPVKGALKKLKETCSNIWKNIDKLSLAKSIGKVGISIATGTTPLALLDIGARYAKDIFTDEDKRNDFINTAGELIKNTSQDTSSYKEMSEFRCNYRELFKAAHIKKLVVLIDDLDRCLPKVAIETLEAIRMFLFMENTVFIIAADDAMIRYSVSEYFPHILENTNGAILSRVDYALFSDKYLEKLIQVPLHIPRIGIAEARLYVLLLFIESETGESKELKALADIVVQKLKKPWALEQLTVAEIKTVLSDTYDSIKNKVKIALSIDTFLAKHTGGNPRNIKRFVNMLLLRTEIARNRGFAESDLEMSILAKMMLIEQYYNDIYKAIAQELREDGTCPAFDEISSKDDGEELPKDTIENGAETKTGSRTKKQAAKEKQTSITPTYKSNTFEGQLNDDDIKLWMKSEPSLSGVDLRPYYFACTEKDVIFFSSQEERLRELVSAIRMGRFTTSSMATQIEKLEYADAKSIFKIITQEAFTSKLSDMKAPPIIEGLRLFIKTRTELQEDLVDYLLSLPAENLGIWAVGGWDDCIPKSCNARQKLLEFYKKVENHTTDEITKRAAKSAQEN